MRLFCCCRVSDTLSLDSPVTGAVAHSPHGLLAAGITSLMEGQSPHTAVHGTKKPAATIIERAQVCAQALLLM